MHPDSTFVARPRCRARPVTRALAALPAVVAAAALAWLPSAASARCPDEAAELAAPDGQPAITPAAGSSARGQLQAMVREAQARSHQVGAARLLADAAEDDVREIRAARGIQASAGGGLGPGGSQSLAGSESSALQLRGNLNVAQVLYDGGRNASLTDWRTLLAESARHGQLGVQEQLALNTVSLALERGRFRLHAQVYGQQVRKMACLVEALETIVRADRGRASELLQAKKSMQQAELAQAAAQGQLRALEVRLRRLVGDQLPTTEGLPGVLLQVETLAQWVADVERSSEIAALTAQVQASQHYVDAVAANARPQVGWNVSATQAWGRGGSRGDVSNGTWAVGLSISMPLLSPGIPPATDAARKRARASELQRAEALESRRFRAAELHEQAQASFDRMRRTAATLRESEQVRSATLQQWQQLGRRSLFDVMGAESEHYALRISYINALTDGQQLVANLHSLGKGVNEWLR